MAEIDAKHEKKWNIGLEYMQERNDIVENFKGAEQEEKLKACLDARSMLVYDRFERPLILFANAFTLRYFKERFPFAKLMESLEISEDTL